MNGTEIKKFDVQKLRCSAVNCNMNESTQYAEENIKHYAKIATYANAITGYKY